jgi:putative ABC transport system permease protein
MELWLTILEQGFIFGVMALGVYITYRILDFPDLTVDGTFPLGAATIAALLKAGVSPILATFISFGAGMLAGAMTGILHTKLKITNLLSSILVMLGLYSINLRIMGKANIPLFQEQTIYTNNWSAIYTIICITILMKFGLDLFLKTKLGFLLKATGDNPQLVTSFGIDIGLMKILALMIANGLVALSGAMMAQYQGFSDVGMGTGVIVMGLASIILGETILKNISFVATTTMVIGGSILYKASTAFALRLGFPATDLKLITAIIVVTALSLRHKNIRLSWKFGRSLGGDTHVANTQSMQNIS